MIDNNKSNLIKGCLCAIACEAIFGLSYIFTKQATGLATAFAFLGWRYIIATFVMSICVALGLIKVDFRRVTETKRKSRGIKPLILVAVFNPAIYFIGETIGISHTTASESGVFLACIPVASLLASSLILREKPAKIQLIGILITLAGVSITVFAAGSSSSLSVVGYLFLTIAVTSYALYAVFVEKASAYSGGEITYIMTLAGALLFGILALAEAGITGSLNELVSLPFRESGFLIAILYQGIISTVFGFFLSNLAIARIGVNRTSSFIGISTVVSILAGVLLLKESFTVFQLIGAIIIILGVYTANSMRTKE